MKRIVTVLSVMFVALALCLSGSVAQAGKKGKKVAKLTTYKGEVVKQTGKKGKLVGVQLKGEDGKIYKVFLNAKSKKMAKELSGKKAEVSAALIRKGTRKKPILWLNVKSYKAIEEPKEEPAAEGDEDEGGGEDEDIP